MWERAVKAWRELPSDADAVFDRKSSIDVTKIIPQVTWGTSPEHVIGVDGRIPDPQTIDDPARRAAIETALDYMGLKPGAPIAGTPVDWVFIGSCTNSRLSDLRAAAEVARGRKVAPGVRAWVVPGSENVKRDAVAEGLDKIFIDAGFEWREPGCSMCLAANGETVAPGQRSVSTSNRNFVGRQGPRARTHLASPARPRRRRSPAPSPTCGRWGAEHAKAVQQADRDRRADHAQQYRHRRHHPHRAAGRKFRRAARSANGPLARCAICPTDRRIRNSSSTASRIGRRKSW